MKYTRREAAHYAAARVYAGRMVSAALGRGALVRPPTCETCGEPPRPRQKSSGGLIPGTIYAHHDDYNEPLSVRWLCASCHKRWHVRHKAVPLRDLSLLSASEAAGLADKIARFKAEDDAERRRLRRLINGYPPGDYCVVTNFRCGICNRLNHNRRTCPTLRSAA